MGGSMHFRRISGSATYCTLGYPGSFGTQQWCNFVDIVIDRWLVAVNVSTINSLMCVCFCHVKAHSGHSWKEFVAPLAKAIALNECKYVSPPFLVPQFSANPFVDGLLLLTINQQIPFTHSWFMVPSRSTLQRCPRKPVSPSQDIPALTAIAHSMKQKHSRVSRLFCTSVHTMFRLQLKKEILFHF